MTIIKSYIYFGFFVRYNLSIDLYEVIDYIIDSFYFQYFFYKKLNIYYIIVVISILRYQYINIKLFIP